LWSLLADFGAEVIKVDPPARSLPGTDDHPISVAIFISVMATLYRRQMAGKGGNARNNLMANSV